MADITEADYLLLKDELITDPKSLGYAAMSNIEAASKLNEIGASGEKIGRETVDGQEANKCVVIGEYTALSAAQRDAWTAIISAGAGQIDVDDDRVKTQIAAIWVAGTDTRVNLLALADRDASRAEILFGRGAFIHEWDVGRARVLP